MGTGDGGGLGDPGQRLGTRLLGCCVTGNVSGSTPRYFSLSLAAIRVLELSGLEVNA